MYPFFIFLDGQKEKEKTNTHLFIFKKEEISFASEERWRDVFIPTHLYSWPFCFRSRDNDKCVVRISLVASQSSLCYVPAKQLAVPVRCCLGQLIVPFCILETGNNSFARPGILMRLVFGDHVAVGRHCAERVCARESGGFCRKV